MSLTETTLRRIRGLLDKGKKIEAIKLHRQVTNMGLKESKDAVEAIARGEFEGTSREDVSHDALEQEVMELLRANGKIHAIKRYRAATGVGLKEAKETVEAIARGEFEGAADTHEGASAPISPARPVTDLLLFTDHEEPGKQLYLPRYRLATRRVGEGREFEVRVEDDPSGGGALSMRLHPYPAAGIEEAVRDADAAQLPHVVDPTIGYNRSEGRRQLSFDEVEELEDGLRVALRISDTGVWHELQTALRETDRGAQLVVQRQATVALREKRATEQQQLQQTVEKLRAQQQAQQRRVEEAKSEAADLSRREQELQEERQRLHQALRKGAKARDHRAEKAEESDRRARKIRERVRDHRAKIEGSVRRRDHRTRAERGGSAQVRDHRTRAERGESAQVRDHRTEGGQGRLTERLASAKESLERVSRQRKRARAKVEETLESLEASKARLERTQKAQQEARERPAFVNREVTLDHVVSPDPFVVLAHRTTEPVGEGELVSARVEGHLYHWDPARPEVVFDLPDRFVLAREAEPPHFPVMRLRFDTADADAAQDVTVELEYHAEPVYEAERREGAQEQLQRATGVDEVRFQPYPAKQPTFRLTLPFGSEEEGAAADDILVDLETGIHALLRMSMEDFQTVYAALFGASTVFLRGEVYVKTGAAEPEEIPLTLRAEELDPDQVYDAILDPTTATTLTRPVTAQAFFEPLADLPEIEIKQITVDFKGAPDATLTPEEPLQEVAVPRSIRSVVLSGVDPEAIDEVDAYQYRLTFVLAENGGTRFVRDEEWRSDSADTLLPELMLEELLA